jgi:hypothetical protein
MRRHKDLKGREEGGGRECSEECEGDLRRGEVMREGERVGW